MSGPNHDLRSNAGRTLYMPEYYAGEDGFGNLALPNVYAVDDASPVYPRETRLVQGKRVFYYGTYNGVVTSTGTTVTATDGDDLFGKFLFSYATQNDMANALLVRKLVNELSIVYNTTVSAARFEDWYSGGYVCGKDTAPSDERMFGRRIVKHSYQSTATSGSVEIWNEDTQSYTTFSLVPYTYASTLELDQPVINSKTGMATTIAANPYKLICWQSDTGYASYRGTVGACMHNDPTATRSVWFQTWGPMFCPHVHAANVGAVANERVVILMADGSVQARESTYDYMDSHYPVVGHIMYDTVFDAGVADEGLPMINVEVSR